MCLGIPLCIHAGDASPCGGQQRATDPLEVELQSGEQPYGQPELTLGPLQEHRSSSSPASLQPLI